MSNSKPLILVFGATGAQGGSVVDSLLKTDAYSLRAVTRNPASDNAQALAKRGVEVVAGDFNAGIPESVYKGVYGVFLLTNFWDPASMFKEYEQSVPVVDAALAAGVSQIVFSTLPDTFELSNGKYDVPHFTAKAKVENYIRGKGFKYTAFPAPGFYYQNFNTFFPPKADENGNLSITLPETKQIGAIDVSQMGGVVAAVFQHPEKYNGLLIPICGENETPQFYVDAISEKLGKKVALNLVPIEVFGTFGFPGAKELADMFGWFNEYGVWGANVNPFLGREIDPSIRNFKDFLVQSDFHL